MRRTLKCEEHYAGPIPSTHGPGGGVSIPACYISFSLTEALMKATGSFLLVFVCLLCFTD